MPTKKQSEAFNKQVDNIMKEMGATEADSHYKYKIATKAGDLFINVWPPDKCTCYSIFCRFDDPGKAKAVLPYFSNLNKHSGKWNFHEYDSAYLLELFSNSLKKIA